MKNIILLISVMFMGLFSYSQHTECGDNQKGKYTSYKASTGEVFKSGQTLDVGMGTGHNGSFISISGADFAGTPYTNPKINTKKFVLKKFYVRGNTKKGFITYVSTKMIGGVQYFIDIEKAIKLGEIVTSYESPQNISDNALNELKKWKDKFDLGLIKKDEYEKHKTRLSSLIK